MGGLFFSHSTLSFHLAILRRSAYPSIMPFEREQLQLSAANLAASGVYIGTSSWKYPGWRGMLYDEARYVWRGKVAESRFERNCLAEYAEVFKTVCVDAAYYTFPSVKYLEGLASPPRPSSVLTL